MIYPIPQKNHLNGKPVEITTLHITGPYGSLAGKILSGYGVSCTGGFPLEIAVSNSRKTTYIETLSRLSREKYFITVTENMESPLALAADVVLKQHVNRETDKWNAQGTTSTTALCMICHALQAAVIEQTGYQAEQFALIHPGGAVGERLNHKAL